MTTKDETIFQLSGTVMDILQNNDNSLNLDELNALGMEIATACYDDLHKQLLPPYRAILTDRDGSVIGSVDLIGVARLGLKSELDWQNAIYKLFGLT